MGVVVVLLEIARKSRKADNCLAGQLVGERLLGGLERRRWPPGSVVLRRSRGGAVCTSCPTRTATGAVGCGRKKERESPPRYTRPKKAHLPEPAGGDERDGDRGSYCSFH